MIRRILVVLGALLIGMGATQLPFASWWIGVAGKLLAPYFLIGFGVLGIALSVTLIIAAASGVVGLRQFIFLIGLITLLGSCVTLANQNLVRDLVDAVLFNRSRVFQMAAVWVSGLIRIGVGAAILYAVARPPVRREPRQAES